MSDEIPVDQLTYEQAFYELQNIVDGLESNEDALEETLNRFARGQALVKRCAQLLDGAELRVKILVNGEIKDFEVDA
jgi:exodeoxyribonuclease VII small subunit